AFEEDSRDLRAKSIAEAILKRRNARVAAEPKHPEEYRYAPMRHKVSEGHPDCPNRRLHLHAKKIQRQSRLSQTQHIRDMAFLPRDVVCGRSLFHVSPLLFRKRQTPQMTRANGGLGIVLVTDAIWRGLTALVALSYPR